MTSIAVGDTVKVRTDGDVLNLRTSPGIASSVRAKLPDGTLMTVIGGPQERGGLLWLQVSTPEGDGWVAAQYVTKDVAAAPASGGGGDLRPIFPLTFRTFLPGISFGE